MELTKINEMSSSNYVKIAIFGKYGIGKTSLLRTLPNPEKVLCLDFEAGLLSVRDLGVACIHIKNWKEARNIACMLHGADSNKAEKDKDKIYTEEHFQSCISKYPDLYESLKNFDTIFVDSITVASRLCLKWCEGQGKSDMRAIYGDLSKELIKWCTYLQHIPDKNVIFVGGMSKETEVDSEQNRVYTLHIEGSKTGKELPGILDEVLCMDLHNGDRKLVCQPYGNYPSKDRSGRLNVTEKADLWHIIQKIRGEVE